MKILTMYGVEEGTYEALKKGRPLLRIRITTKGWLRPRKEVVVEPVNPQDEGLQRLAAEVRERIARVIRERAPGKPFYHHKPTDEHPGGRGFAGLDDPNVLEAIGSEYYIWNYAGHNELAGYYIITSASHVSEQQSRRPTR